MEQFEAQFIVEDVQWWTQWPFFTASHVHKQVKLLAFSKSRYMQFNCTLGLWGVAPKFDLLSTYINLPKLYLHIMWPFRQPHDLNASAGFGIFSGSYTMATRNSYMWCHAGGMRFHVISMMCCKWECEGFFVAISTLGLSIVAMLPRMHMMNNTRHQTWWM